MFEDEPQPPRNNRRNPEPQFNWKGLVLLAASALLIALAFLNYGSHSNSSEKNFADFKKMVEEGTLLVTPDKPLSLVEEPGTGIQYIEGHVNEGPGADGKSHERSFRTPVNIQYQKDEIAKSEHRQNLKDAADLAELADQLKIELEKNDRYVVSMATIKKTDDIEKLAKKIRSRLRHN